MFLLLLSQMNTNLATTSAAIDYVTVLQIRSLGGLDWFLRLESHKASGCWQDSTLCRGSGADPPSKLVSVVGSIPCLVLVGPRARFLDGCQLGATRSSPRLPPGSCMWVPPPQSQNSIPVPSHSWNLSLASIVALCCQLRKFYLWKGSLVWAPWLIPGHLPILNCTAIIVYVESLLLFSLTYWQECKYGRPGRGWHSVYMLSECVLSCVSYFQLCVTPWTVHVITFK